MNSDTGFSLIETHVAFTVLSLVLLSSMELFGDGTERVAHAQQQAADMPNLKNAIVLVRSHASLGDLQQLVKVTISGNEKNNFKDATLLPFLFEVSTGTEEDVETLRTIILDER